MKQRVGLKFNLKDKVYLETNYSNTYVVMPTPAFFTTVGMLYIKNRKTKKVLLVKYDEIHTYDFLTKKFAN